ncbi:MAG: bifunctional UDP-N-acetylglucosamine diphosphorylase/glucosamine-1-phosphate N-acetyltransferase GlmU [Rhodospirillales bacterium]|nr:bifunctional UDP-N-acetylglucosamine diphosphorylase/glucosamine-1-phosphate N-acetyltransferase GlmU [Alphaproteobacteria bacterium]MCB9981494.1 bifunctional UDP-N-acetylglucosamine diphosphorylase/glucosamine-1-phosphate N-acetyltransferase GlmU [Rhodospirillales bacterium]
MSTKPLAIVILAAGFGTRMKSSQAKVMHTLAGKPMINWLLNSCESLNPEKIVVVIGPEMPDLEKAVKPHICVVQKVRDGTGGAVRTAMSALEGFGGDVLILLGDTPLITPATLSALRVAKDDHALAILGCIMDNPHGYGRLILGQDGMLENIIEEKDADPEQKAIQLVNTGAFCADGSQLCGWLNQIDSNNSQNEFYITQLPAIIREQGGVTAAAIIKNPAEVKGCNTRTDLAALEKTLQTRLREDLMNEGVFMQDPDTVYLWHDTKIAPDCIIEPNVYFGPGVTLESRVHIKAFSYLEGAHVKAEASVGPFARLRPDTQIGKGARIGNFVEIKKSIIGPGSKIGHLAYVGDCHMGEEVNFSAGAITVNYDGFQKHRTVIGKNVMVGSNVNLVAPVHIDDGAFVAAGSTITEDVPADALSIARDPAEIRQGWAAKYRKIKEAAQKKSRKRPKKAS